MNKGRLILSAAVCCVLLAIVGSQVASSNTKASLTFSKDIAPIFYNNCIGCHRPGEIAPMSLMTYKEVRPWAKAIREKVANRDMPPWHPDAKYGQWANDLRLSQKDVDAVVAWVDGGAVEGNAKDLPPMPKLTTGWQIGQPDIIFQMPTEFTVPAEGSVPYQHFTVPTNFKEDRYVQALEARAGNLSVVHHIVMYVRDPAEQARARGQNRKFNIADGILGALSPGETPFIAKPGQAKLIKAGSQLVFQMHYTPNGTETKDRSVVGLIFAKGPVDKIVQSKAAFDTRFAIPPGAQNYEVKAEYEFEEDSHIISLMPHMHLRGKDIIYRAIYPDGRSEILLSVPKYNFAWQVYYYPLKPIAAPKGTRLEAVAHFDNSTKNPRNPDPNREVRFGEQTWDEMMNGFFDYTLDNQKLGGERAATGSSQK
ncbi:MAG TPA: thiol-disulfide isomerase [Blastocatellia bacterium]|nr:thiol-disulfide isomerase [Blastocatellia bacterium]